MAPMPERRAEGLLGPLEYAAMRALWSAAPVGVGHVLAELNAGKTGDQQLAYTTVMTVLSRLHGKGLVGRERRGRGYAYTPRFDEPALVEHLGRRAVDDVLQRYGDVALAQFAAVIEDADEDLIRRLRDTAGTSDA